MAKVIPMDPWGRPYVYKCPGDHGDFDLYSLGKDGVAGGTGEGADITNWGS
jgi:general secretion pathway protein G